MMGIYEMFFNALFMELKIIAGCFLVYISIVCFWLWLLVKELSSEEY
jgi:hypothetical protein